MIYFNDQPVAPAKGRTLTELLLLMGREPDQTVVTVDGKFIPRSEYRIFEVPDGARVQAHELLAGG